MSAYLNIVPKPLMMLIGDDVIYCYYMQNLSFAPKSIKSVNEGRRLHGVGF